MAELKEFLEHITMKNETASNLLNNVWLIVYEMT